MAAKDECEHIVSDCCVGNCGSAVVELQQLLKVDDMCKKYRRTQHSGLVDPEAHNGLGRITLGSAGGSNCNSGLSFSFSFARRGTCRNTGAFDERGITFATVGYAGDYGTNGGIGPGYP